MVVLVDAMGEVHRFDAAMGNLATKSGKKSGMVFGFLRALGMYKKLFGVVPIVVWDGSPVARRNLIATYKSTRNPRAEAFYREVSDLKKVLPMIGVIQVIHPGWEADDVLGTLAVWATEQGQEVRIITGDHDLLQTVNKTVNCYFPKSKETADVSWVVSKYGVEPAWLPVMWALTGDPSDNIKGIGGVGEKTALKMIKEEVGSIEEALVKFGERAESFKVAIDALSLRVNLLPELNWTWPAVDWVGAKAFFEDYEFNSFLKEGSAWPGFVEQAGIEAERTRKLFVAAV